MIDYTIFYKTPITTGADWSSLTEWDLFISAFDPSERVRIVYDKVNAPRKHWLIMPEYGYTRDEYPGGCGEVFAPEVDREADFVLAYVNHAGIVADSLRMCIDTTGFIKPYMMFLLRWLMKMGAKKVDLLYSEPNQYVRKDETRFSDENVIEVRQVQGFEGNHTSNTSNDLLVIGAGYDHELIAHTAESKNSARKVEIIGLPSLRPDMYQESVLRAQKAAEAVGGEAPLGAKVCYAPANDPFVTASVLQRIVRDQDSPVALTNLYLCALGTKPQALGFTIYYLMECRDRPASVLYPVCRSYPRGTSKGLSRVWVYTVEFP